MREEKINSETGTKGACAGSSCQSQLVAVPNRKQQDKYPFRCSDLFRIHLAIQAVLKPLPPRLSQ